jgi:hypothetical protein
MNGLFDKGFFIVLSSCIFHDDPLCCGAVHTMRSCEASPAINLGLPLFRGQVDRSHAMTLRLSIDAQPDNPTKTRRRFIAQQKAEAVALFLSKGLNWPGLAREPGNSVEKKIFHAGDSQLCKGVLPPAVSHHRHTFEPVSHCLALTAAGCSPQRLVCLEVHDAKPRPA